MSGALEGSQTPQSWSRLVHSTERPLRHTPGQKAEGQLQRLEEHGVED